LGVGKDAASSTQDGYGHRAVPDAEVVVERGVVGRGDEDAVVGFGDAHEEVVEDGAASGGYAQLVGVDFDAVVTLGEDSVHVRLGNGDGDQGETGKKMVGSLLFFERIARACWDPLGALTAMAVRRRSLPFMLSYAAVLAGCGDANPAISLRCTASTVRKFCATARLT
jgi:hypothetical protein